MMHFFFDEMYMSSLYILNKIWLFRNEHPPLIVIGAGDVKQLPNIEPSTNNQNGEEYVDNCIDIIFKYNVFLQIRKKVGGKIQKRERHRKINEIYDDFGKKIWMNFYDIRKCT